MFLDLVRKAALKSKKYVKRTPLELGYYSSQLTKNNIYFKREDLQHTFSFKLRGAYNKIYKLYTENNNLSVIACSAGNHAQGVAYSSSLFNLDSKIVMPTITPSIKINQVKRYGGDVILYGNNYDEAYTKALELSKSENRILIHPYNDNDIIVGAGTIGKEIYEDLDSVDYIFIPVGGGGLISGISSYIKSINSKVKIIGVEAEDSQSMTLSFKNKKITKLDTVGSFADGTAVKEVGDKTFDICTKYVDDMITISNDDIATNIKNFYLDSRTIAEPSGVLSLGGCIKYLNMNNIINKNIVNVISGANMDFERLRYVTERSTEEFLLKINIPEKIGSFKELYNFIYPGNVTEFRYRYNNNNIAQVLISICDKDIVHNLQKKYSLVNLSNSDFSKEHSRYLISNSSPITYEKILRFLFPERPGELGRFLNKISDKWNITLFHYRNRGGVTGDVLVGIMVNCRDELCFNNFLKLINYEYYYEEL